MIPLEIDEILVQEPFPDALKLFAVVQRFEYSLKRAGFLVGRQAEASWKKFGRALPSEFFSTVREYNRTRVLIEAPPSKLVWNEETNLAWEEQPAPRDNEELFNTVRNVRNSLFHGEKRFENERDRALVEAALHVLNMATVEARTLARDRQGDDRFVVFSAAMRGFIAPLPDV